MEDSIELLRKIDRIHPYPAKFTVDLALEYIKKYSSDGDLVYDPFVGSGTTLLASKALHRRSIGTDINHIAILISKAKILRLSKDNIENLKSFISEFEISYKKDCDKTLLFDYPSIHHWFTDESIKILSYIKNQIYKIKDKDEQTFAKVIFSSIINIASNQESDTRYAAVYKPKLNIDYIADIFLKKFKDDLEIYSKLSQNDTDSQAVLDDSKNCTKYINKESVDLLLTSPPYPNTYDYYLYHKHRMNWLDCDVKYSMDLEIGSRREFSSLKKPKEKFNNDMYLILEQCNLILKPGGYAVLVMGDGKIQGEIYEAKSNMEEICAKFKWELVDYTFTMLDQTSRSFQKSYRTKGKKEHILVFKKRGDN